MQWAKTLENYPWIMYLVGGFLIGLFIGYQVLPKILPRKNASLTAAELQSILAVQQQLEAKLGTALNALDGVSDARVQLSTPLSSTKNLHRKASVTIPHSDALSAEQLATIAEQVASGVDGLLPGSITILDAAGRTLNTAAVAQHEKKIFWTNIAINVAKILGILAALITVRFIIQAIHKSILGEEAPGC